MTINFTEMPEIITMARKIQELLMRSKAKMLMIDKDSLLITADEWSYTAGDGNEYFNVNEKGEKENGADN